MKRHYIALVAFCLIGAFAFCPKKTFAATVTWTGSSGDWDTAANSNGGSVPSVGANFTLLNYTSASGAFSAVNLPVQALWQYNPATNAVSVTLTNQPGALNITQTNGGMLLQVSNLSAGSTVVIQKYLDVNSNGIVDAGDWLVQQFSITDGQGPPVIGGVTNINVPGDLDLTANGSITTQLNSAVGGVEQAFSAQYLYVLSSPTLAFAPITNQVVVTNPAYPQSLNGAVTCNAANVPYAIVWLAAPPQTSGGFKPLAGTVADANGHYAIPAAPGTYRLLCCGNNFVGNLETAPALTLINGVSITTNLTLAAATRSISGSISDATNSLIGLPGVILAATADNGLVGFGFTDSNGNFTLPAVSGVFQIGEEQLAVGTHAYVSLNNDAQADATDGNVSGVTISLPKVTALIDGAFTDTNENPLPGVLLEADNGTNGSGIYQAEAATDNHGHYVLGVVAGNWSPAVQGFNPGYINDIFSTGPSWTYENSGPGTNLAPGNVAQADFAGVVATNLITGSVEDENDNPIIDVGVFSIATINGSSYTQYEDTDANGDFSLLAANGNWDVSVNCNGGADSLASLGYNCSGDQSLTIANNNATLVFHASAVSGAAQFTASPTNGPAELTVQFYGPTNDSNNNPIVGWDWKFGDGGVSLIQNPSYTYNSPGIFNPSLTVTNNLGDTEQVTGPQIWSTGGTNPPDILSYSWTSAIGVGGQAVLAVDDLDGAPPFTFQWEFDGANIPGATGSTLTISNMAITNGGTYAVLAANPNGTNVSGAMVLALETSAQFTANPTLVSPLQSVLFNSPATDGYGNSLTNWSWSFGDTGTATGPNPSYSYAAVGNYTPTLTAINANGIPFVIYGPSITVEEGVPACDPPPSGVVAWWQGENNALDLTGSHNGVLENGVAFAPGMVGQAFSFNGEDQYVDAGSWSVGRTWTIEAWINASSYDPSGRQIIAGDLDSCYDWAIALVNGQPAVISRQPGGCTQSTTASNTVLAGTWYHIAGACDGTNSQIYVNGVFQASAPVEPNYVGDNTSVEIGGDTCCGEYFSGLIDEVTIYDRALSASEITAIYNAGASGKCANELVSWPPPAPITYGAALNSVQLDASTSLSGTFSYTPANGAILDAGFYTLSTVFTPTDTNDYPIFTNTTPLEVDPAPLTVTVSNAFKAYGQPNPPFTGVISGLLNGDNITATYSSSATSISPIGSYPIAPTLIDPNNRLVNYTVTTNLGALSVLVTNLIPATAVAYVRSDTELPWGVSDNENTLTAVFGPGWQDLRYETVDPSALFSSSNQFIFMMGSDDDALAMAAFLNANLPVITNWVSTGGSLYLNAAPNEGSNIYFGFGITLDFGDDTDAAGAVNTNHPIFNGPFLPVGAAFTGTHFGHGVVSGAGLTGLLTNASDGNFVLAEESYPSGHLMAGGMTTFNFQMPQPEASNLLANILFYASSFAQSETFANAVTNIPNLLGFWPFTPASGSNSIVNTNSDNPGTFAGNAAIGGPGSGPPLAGMPSNTAVLLDGSESYVNTSLAGGLTNNQGSIAAWFYLTNLPSVPDRSFYIAGESQSGNDFDLQIDSDNIIRFYTEAGGSTAAPAAFTTNDIGIWHFAAATFTSSSSRNIYIDGALVASSTPGAHNPAGAGTFSMGASDVFGGRYFEGALGDIAVFNRQLTGAEVSNLYMVAAPAGGGGAGVAITWAAPTPITYGAPLSSLQLNATAGQPGVFNYNPALGIILNAGTNTLSLIFTPYNRVVYSVESTNVTLVVSNAPLVATASNAIVVVGQGIPALGGALNGVVNNDDITATFSTTATNGSPVGTYPITPVLTDPNGRLPNYSVTINPGTLSIIPTPVTTVISSPANGAIFTTNQGISFSASATTIYGIQGIALFANSALVATNSTTNISALLTNLAPGPYTLAVVATDAHGLTASSTVYVTVNAPGTSLIDFDALAAGAGPVTGAVLSNYLAGYGVSLGGVSFGAHVQVVNQSAYSGSAVAVPSSLPNLLTEAGSSQPMSFTLLFASPVQSLSFTRVEVLTNNGSASVSHPAWTAQLLDASGNVEASSVSEPLLTSPTNIPARTFTLAGSSIAGVQFSSDSQQTAAFPAVLLDDVLLDANAGGATNPLSISLAAAEGPFVSPASVTLQATVSDGYGSNYYVAFYAGPALIGTSAGGTLVWSNVLNGTYAVTAKVVDGNGYALLSSTVTVTVQPPANSTVINFDSLSAPASGGALASYLAGDGAGLGGSSAGSTVVVESQAQEPLAGLALASSPPNLLTQTGLNGQMSYTLDFSNWMTQVSFTRPELLGTNPFVTHPAWQVTAYDALGNPLAAVQQSLISSYTNVPAQAYVLQGDGIASLQVTSDGSALTTFPALLLDDLILTEGTSVVVTNPLAGQVFTSNGPIVIGAGVATQTGAVTNVNFFFNLALAGSAQGSPFSILWTAPSNGQYALTAVAQNSSGVVVTSAPVNITVASGFAIVSPPASQIIAQGAGAAFSVTTTGSAVAYQWQSNNAVIAGATASTFTVSNAPAGVVNYTVAASSGGQTITSPSAVLTVLAPPTLTPVAFVPTNANITNIGSGQTVTMTEAVAGPVTFQWRLNGTGIAGATNSFYTISNAQPLNSGNYQVVVANTAAFSVSPTFPVAVNLGSNALSTTNASLAGAMTLNANPLVGLPVGGNNSNSPAADPLAPQIAGKRAGNLLWFSWTPTNSGNVSLTTRGSSFDTLLGVYTTNVGAPASPADLTVMAQDDDSGGFFTSLVSFNAASNTTYEIAVAGYHGASGTVILGLPSGSGYNLGQTAPAFTLQPPSQLVQPGATVTLTALATNAASYQWYFSGAPVPGGSNDSLVISNFPISAAGNYWEVAANPAGAAQSQTAAIELATNGNSLSTPTTLTVDKFGDAVDLTESGQTTHYRREDDGGDTGGFTLSQSFSTLGATKEEGEPNHAGQPGGASYWYSYTAPTGGTIQFDTAGSTFNTILAIYTGPGDSFATLVSAGAAYTTNYVQLGQPVVLVSNVTASARFFIAVDGYLGASGAAKLNVAFTQISNAVINTNLPVLILTNSKASVAINFPANGYATTNPALTVRGVVRGLVGLQEPLASFVQMAVNTNAAGPVTLGPTRYAPVLTAGPGGVEEAVAQESMAWSSNLTLVPGPNVITVQGISLQGSNTENATLPVTHTIYLTQGESQLTLRTNGSGRITGPRNGATLEVGRNYTATATPIGDWVLTQWTSGANIDALTNLSSQPSLTFTFYSNMVLQANFGPNPFPAVAGVYNGLFSPSNGVTEASSGFLTATLPASSRGAYSAKILLDGGSYPFNGIFTADGLSQKTIHRPGQSPLTLDLQLDLSATNNQLTGQISGSDGSANWVSQLQAWPTPFHTRANAAKYTLILPLATNPPGGYGYATLNENTSGRLTLDGRLGDGTTASQSVLAATNGAIPLYVSLYSHQGSLQGWLTLTPTLTGSNLTWIKLSSRQGAHYSSGFTNTNLAILGSLYTVPAPGDNALALTNGTLTLSHSGLNGDLIYSNLSLMGDTLINNDTNNPTNHLSGAVNRATGALTLTFRPTGQTLNTTARGVILQNTSATNAAGSFTTSTNPPGSFLLQQ